MTEIRDILQNIGYGNLKDFGAWFRTKPLYRTSDNDTVLAINKNTGYWYDYKLCRGGNLSELVKISLNLSDIKEADLILKDKFSISKADRKPEKTFLNQVKTYEPEILNGLIKDHSYWIKRNILEEIISEFQGGVAAKGMMLNRYVFPIFDLDKKIIGFSGRATYNSNSSNFIKWKHIGPKKEWVYPCHLNQQHLQKEKVVFLVESIGDLLNLWQNGYKNIIVTFGLTVSPKVIKFLLQNSIEKVIIAFNNDSSKNSAGNNAAFQAKEKLLIFFDESQLKIKLPSKKDFGEMSKNEIDLYMGEVNG